jgi:hypothetical protein
LHRAAGRLRNPRCRQHLDLAASQEGKQNWTNDIPLPQRWAPSL